MWEGTTSRVTSFTIFTASVRKIWIPPRTCEKPVELYCEDTVFEKYNCIVNILK